MNQPYFFSVEDQNMKSSMNVVPALVPSPLAEVHIGPSPTMNSAVGVRSNGFLNTISLSHSERPLRYSLEPPISISSHSLITLNSIAAEGPRLNVLSPRFCSPSTPSATTASGSFSAADAFPTGSNKATAKATHAMPLITPHLCYVCSLNIRTSLRGFGGMRFSEFSKTYCGEATTGRNQPGE